MSSGPHGPIFVSTMMLLCTDFSDEIANLTLAEKPNALYKCSRSWKAHYDTTSTDSEEVDSDSGYSSPLHRRKQASSGTHPVAGPSVHLGFLPQTSQVMLPLNASSAITAQHSPAAVSLAAASQLNSSVYAAYLQSGIGHGKLSSRAASGDYPLSGRSTGYPTSTSCYMQSYPPLASGIAAGMGKATGSGSSSTPSTEESFSGSYVSGIPASSDLSSNLTNVTSNVTKQTTVLTQAQTQTQLAKNVISSKSEPEQQTEIVATGRKRRRRRSRCKKRDPDDTGALSDEPFDLTRTHSSSNVSRCSTDVNTDHVLQFEDEDEFPDLKASAREELRGGFSSDTGRKSSTPTTFLTYSDILKKQTVSSFK